MEEQEDPVLDDIPAGLLAFGATLTGYSAAICSLCGPYVQEQLVLSTFVGLSFKLFISMSVVWGLSAYVVYDIRRYRRALKRIGELDLRPLSR